jgi:hypothetical protein
VATELSRHTGRMLGFAKTQMMRGQNRYVAALREAVRIVEQALDGGAAVPHPARATGDAA